MNHSQSASASRRHSVAHVAVLFRLLCSAVSSFADDVRKPSATNVPNQPGDA